MVPCEARNVMKILQNAGYEAYLVGGCVRDCLMGITPKDWDVATSALPQETKLLFKKTFDTGIKHGTVTVLTAATDFAVPADLTTTSNTITASDLSTVTALRSMPIEVTTYRIDGTYSDNRRPDSVIFTLSILKDLARRDFTINAMAWNPFEEVCKPFEGVSVPFCGVLDPFGGLSDIKDKIIRTVGNPSERFKEDALRMLRAVRFSAVLNFKIEESTAQSISLLASSIENISLERIRDELCKILLSNNPAHLSLLRDLGLLKHILPEVDVCFQLPQNHPWHIFDVGHHLLKVLASTNLNLNFNSNSNFNLNLNHLLVLRLAALLHDIGKVETHTTDENGMDHFYGHPHVSAEIARKILTRLHFDNKTIHAVSSLVAFHDMGIPSNEKTVRRYLNLMGNEIYLLYIQLRLADSLGQNLQMSGGVAIKIEAQKGFYNKIISKNECFSLKHLAIDGKDLIEIGFRGPEIGDALHKLLDKVLDNPSFNMKNKLLSEAINLKSLI